VSVAELKAAKGQKRASRAKQERQLEKKRRQVKQTAAEWNAATCGVWYSGTQPGDRRWLDAKTPCL
jgi:hypothetical protein